MGQKHKPFREFRTPFALRDIRENPRSNVRACASGDGAICSKNRKIVPYHGANPNTRNGARLRSPSPIMAPDYTLNFTPIHVYPRLKVIPQHCVSLLRPILASLARANECAHGTQRKKFPSS